MSNRTVSGFLSILGGKVGSILLGIAITPLLVRVLGSEGYGEYAFILSVFAVIGIFARAGISAGIRKYISEARSEQNWQEHVFAFYTRIAVGLATIIGFSLVLFGRYGPAEQLVGAGFSTYIVLLAAMLVTDQLFYVSRYTLVGLNFEQYSEPLSVLKQFLFGVFGLTLAYIGFDVAGVLVGTAIASLVCAVAATWILRNHIDLLGVFRPIPSKFPRRNLLSFNILNTLFILLTISLYNVDILLLQPMVGSQKTGLYKSALVVSEFLWMIPQAVQIVFIHSSSELWSKGNDEEITLMVSRATRYTLLFTLLLSLGIAALAPEFMALYFGAEFTDAVRPLLLLLPGVLGFAVARPIYAIGQGKGSLRLLIIATGTAAAINLVLNLVFIPRYGMAGAAVATSIGYGSMLAFHGVAARRIGYDPFEDLRLLPIVITTVVAAMVIFGLASLIESTITSLAVVPLMGFAVYTILAFRTRAIDPDEIIPVLDQAPKPISDWSTKAIQYIS